MSKKIHISSFDIPCSILVLVKTGIRYWTPCKKYQKQLSAYGGLGGELILIFIPDPTKWSRRFSAANDPQQDDHDGDHQKNVNETAQSGGSDQTQDPQYDQNSSDN